MEIANNNIVEDWELSGKIEKIVFTDNILELKIPLYSENEINKFIQDTEKTKSRIAKIKSEMKFKKVICRFDFGDFEPSEELQKKLAQLQDKIFDEVTIQMIEGDFNTFKSVLEDSKVKLNKPIATLIDLNQHPEDLNEYCKYLLIFKPVNTRWIYHKIDTSLQKYRVIAGMMTKENIEYFLTGCRLRCSIKNFENIAISIIAKFYFGFKGCCQEYHPLKKNKTKRKGFSPTMDYFNPKTCEFERIPNKDYRKNRIGNLFRLDEIESIQKIKKINLLFQHLNKS